MPDVAMPADDKLGSTREDAEDLAPYLAAFAEVGADPNQRLIVAERDGVAVGTFQLSFIPGVSQRGLNGSRTALLAASPEATLAFLRA